MRLDIGPWGLWSTGLRFRDARAAADAAIAFEEAGYSALWMTGGIDDPFPRVRELLAATSRITVATGILSIWSMPASDVRAALDVMSDEERDRFVLGLGVSHASVVDRGAPGLYDRPLARMRAYLDDLDLDRSGGSARRVLAALGPKMLELAATRSAGAHPYLTTPEHTAAARAAMGDRAFLAPTQMVLLDADPTTARESARRHLSMYLSQPNYLANWRRLGFEEEDTAAGGSDRLIDALVAWGDLDRVTARLRSHLDAGADHVCIQLLDREKGWKDQPLPVEDGGRLAAALMPRTA